MRSDLVAAERCVAQGGTLVQPFFPAVGVNRKIRKIISLVSGKEFLTALCFQACPSIGLSKSGDIPKPNANVYGRQTVYYRRIRFFRWQDGTKAKGKGASSCPFFECERFEIGVKP